MSPSESPLLSPTQTIKSRKSLKVAAASKSPRPKTGKIKTESTLSSHLSPRARPSTSKKTAMKSASKNRLSGDIPLPLFL